MSAASIPGLGEEDLPVLPLDTGDAVIREGVAEKGTDGAANAGGRGFDVCPFTHQKRHESSALRLQQVVARLADKPGFSGIERRLAELIETTKGVNDGEVLIEIGKLLFWHGAHCMDAVRRGRKPYYRVDLEPASQVRPTEFPRWSRDRAGDDKPNNNTRQQ